tara:strand:- start:538 stop:732 length:195 start_codon:yes stop_codon:yes gene_type:complete
MTTIVGKEQIDAFRARVLLRGLKLEMLGMTRRGQSCYAIIKQEYGLKGSKQKVYDQFKVMLDIS